MSEKKYKVRFAPSFMESLAKIPEEEREELMAAIRAQIPQLAENPYLGTPLYGGPLLRTTNWFRRQWWAIALRLKSR